MRRVRLVQLPSLSLDFTGDSTAESRRRCHEQSNCIGVVFRLSEQIRCDKSWIPGIGEDNYLRRASEQIDRAVLAHETLGSSDEAIPRAEDLVHAGNRAGSVRERGDGLRTSHANEGLN